MATVFVTTRTVRGVPASSPSNSPSCHWRASSQSGSWTRASIPGRGSPELLWGSRRVHDGGSRRANDRIAAKTSVLMNGRGMGQPFTTEYFRMASEVNSLARTRKSSTGSPCKDQSLK